MDAIKKYTDWCTDPYFDEETRAELKAIEGDEKEIADRFYKELEFGTGGMRGVIGFGTNRMNIYTVRKASQGLANFVLKENGADRGIVIAYDSRRMSPEFAKEAALCFAANNIKVYIFESLRPTPELSFALRQLGCIAGIVITASHNPSEYNGYKVYWEDGAQITAPKDEQIIAEVNAIESYNSVKTMSEADAIKAGLYNVIGKEIDDEYIKALKSLVLSPEVIKKQASSLKIVYTPLHGTGNLPVRRVLSELGFENVYIVPEQEMPDGAFPTVGYPNPEDPKAFALALELAKKVDADLVLATDPDADRLGVYAKDSKTGEYVSFTGNMSGMVICDYQLAKRKEMGTLPKNGALVTTIVSGKMARAMAKDYNIEILETLTGFKFIGEKIKEFEQTGKYEYLFGFEESYGCLIGTHARDKDAVVAVMALCEVAADCKEQGITLWDKMIELYERYGYYKEELYTVTLKGIDGAEKIQSIMSNVRSNPPEYISQYKVNLFADYKTNVKLDYASGAKCETGLPCSNVLYFEMDNDMWCCIRPSGTEPKVKLYMGVKGKTQAEADSLMESFKAAFLKLLED